MAKKNTALKIEHFLQNDDKYDDDIYIVLYKLMSQCPLNTEYIKAFNQHITIFYIYINENLCI